ncbi:glycine betaine ABC transporter substrate-binding protein [Aureimonas sp. ME7]|uniref:glycine betaine ABC transporter substrate-binding protein n=1 Tax=Aureimonas sp. ME7 TaxID=2744252 RepID=UPI0015F7398B|nr:glycine betaine ABC transporter substrate-binding protein [Aureimonas sp. ME7]
MGAAPPVDAAGPTNTCGTVRIASMNWGSAEVMAAIDRFILEHGFGCDAVLVPGDTMPTFESMTASGEPDVAPEIFVNQFRDELDAAVRLGRIDYGAKVLADGSQEGFWIPQYLADAHPEIRRLSDALARPDLFQDDQGAQGVMQGCPAGWGCQIMVENLFRAAGGERKGFRLKEIASSVELDASIEAAFTARRGWIGYYWSPTGILGRYPMKKLAFDVPFDRAEWLRCTTQPECPDPKPNAWTPAEVRTLVSARLEHGAPAPASYLAHRSWTNAVVNQVLRWKDENGADGDAAALHFLRRYPSVWRAWLPAGAATRVEAAL